MLELPNKALSLGVRQPMRYRCVIIFISFLMSGCVYLSASPSVQGTVTDQKGNPVIAKVELLHEQLGKMKTTDTKEDGSFGLGPIKFLTPIPFSAVILSARVTITAEGYRPESYVVEGSGKDVRNVQLEEE